MADGMILADLVAGDFDFPSSGNANPDKASGREMLIFPNGSNSSAISRPRWMHLNRDTGNDITVRLCWKVSAGASADVRWRVELERYQPGVTDLSDEDTFAVLVEETEAAPTMDHKPKYSEILISHSLADLPQSGDMFRIRITRVPGHSDDTFTGSAELLGVLAYESEPS